MSKEQFLVYNMKPDSLMMIKKCNDIIDDAKWTASLAKESENRSTMQNIVDNYDSVVEYLKRQ